MSAAAPAEEVPAYFATGWTGGQNPWVIALVVTMATFMEVLDTSVANVSLSHIAGNLSVSQDESTWVLTSYLVSNAIVLPISGWIASRIGRKRFYMTCVALFTGSSLLCGLAPSLGWLVFFRVVQGVGGGGLGPSEQAILTDTFPPAKRGMAFAVYGMATILAPAMGPTLGGFITDHLTWRWVFFINVPVGIASLFLSSRVVTDPPHLVRGRDKAGTIDFVGLGLIAIGLGCLEVVLDKGQEADWFHSSYIVGFSIASAVALVSFVVWEWNHEHPIIQVRLFQQRTFALSNLMMLTLGLMLFGTTVLIPLYLQTMMGYSAQQSGMVLLPPGILIICAMPIVGGLVSRVDARYLIALGFLVVSLALFRMTTHINLEMDFWTVVSLRSFQAIGLALLFVPINTMAYASVSQKHTNAVSGIVNLSRNIGGDIGIAVVATTISRRAQFHQAMLSSHTTAYDQSFVTRVRQLALGLEHAGVASVEAAHRAVALAYRELVRQSYALAYLDAIKVFAVATLLMVPLLLLTRKTGNAGAPTGH